MLKIYLSVALFGVLFGAANSDIECYLKKNGVNPIGNVRQEIINTQCVNPRMKGLRQDMKTCEVEINVDGLEKFMHDACNNVSGLLKVVADSSKCLAEYGDKAASICEAPIYDKETFKENTHEYCEARGKIEKCLIDEWGKPCEKSGGVTFLKRMQEATDGYLKDICGLVGGATVNNVFMLSMISGVLLALSMWL